jgi:pyruvate dehydrogenase E2 component (dihydrolipoamide acetyltransferase)
MKYEITLPVLSDTMSSGRLARWLKQVGDKINKGDVIAEMESDKAIMEVEAFHEGYLAEPLAPANTDIPIGQVIGYIVDEQEKGSVTEPAKTPPAMTAGQTQETVSSANQQETVSKPADTSKASAQAVVPSHYRPVHTNRSTPNITLPVSGKRIASPHARALAMKLGIDLAAVTPGKDGHIQAEEVLAVAHQSPTLNLDAGPPYRLEPLSLMQQAVVRNMIATLTTPTFRTTASLSLESLKKITKQHKLSLTLLLAYVCALTIKANPQFNAVYTPEGMAHRERVDVGIAVDVAGGLLTPVLRDAAERPVDELAEDWRILKDKINRQRLVQEDYEGASFYLSNLGLFPVVHSFDALVPLGAAAILAIGAEQDGHYLFTLSCDHRVVSGADSARFLTTLQDYLQHPDKLLVQF